MENVLVINSYGGSLLLGTRAADLPIRGSYEDDGFGLEAQRLNFPELNFKAKLADWPAEDDLRETVVIAHPPCAPFSIMNPMKGQEKYQGPTADGFQCHRQVMEYSLSKNCRALAVESVPGVLKAAAEYQAYAVKYGYGVFFLRVNSVSFGVPQWRPRIWVLFLRNCGKLGVNLEPVYKKLSSILTTEGTTLGAGSTGRKSGSRTGGAETHIIIRRLMEAKVDPEIMVKMFAGEYGAGTILQLGQKVLDIPSEELGDNFAEVRRRWNLGGLFAAMMPRILDPETWAPTILGGSAWFINGRPLFLEEYNQIMGFPADYKWPDSYSDPRLYLSKGVCPPVATWVLQQLVSNICYDDRVYQHYCEPGGVLDLCPKKADVEDRLAGREPQEEKAPREKKVRKIREDQPNTQAPRVRASASDLGQQFLASLRGGTQ